MKTFEGFPGRGEFTAVPNIFFSRLLPEIDDLDELKVTLGVIAHLYRKKGYPQFVSYATLYGDSNIVGGLSGGGDSNDALKQALEQATTRGSLLHLALNDDKGASQHIYLLNTEENRRTALRLVAGEIVLEGLVPDRLETAPMAAPQENIFSLYEANIGLLTPMLAEELKEAEQLYPPEWIKDAIREAVSLNKRSWRYIARILENWVKEGRGSGAHQGNTGQAGGGKYLHGDVARR